MAIIKCPSCNEKISDKAKSCGSCQYDLVHRASAQGLSEEQLASKNHLSRIKKRYSLQMQAMIGIILVLGGSLLWYFGGREGSSNQAIISFSMLGAGSILYLITRIRLIFFKRS